MASLEDAELLIEEDAENRELAPRPTFARRGVVALGGLFALAGAVLLLHRSGSSLSLVGHHFDFTGLSDKGIKMLAEDPKEWCEERAPYLKIIEDLRNNLGNKGPNTGFEGIIYQVEAENIETDSHNLELHVHAVSNFTKAGEEEPDESFKVGWPKENGIHGKFAAINLKQGSEVHLLFHIFDADKKEDVTLPYLALSFYDFDAGKGGTHSIEYLEIETADYDRYVLTNETLVDVTTEGVYTKFTATEEGTGDDNPVDPMMLTAHQKNKAVTFLFKEKTSIHLKIGATSGESVRVFTFIARPSMLCAPTVVHDEDGSTRKFYPGEQGPVEFVLHGGAHGREPAVLLLFGLVFLQRFFM